MFAATMPENLLSSPFAAAITEQHSQADDFADGALVLAEDLSVVYASPGALATFGYKPRAILGSDLSVLFPHNGSILEAIELVQKSLLDYCDGKTFSKRVAHGDLVEGMTAADHLFKARVTVSPLLVDGVDYLVLFLGVESEHTETENIALSANPDSPFSPSNSNPAIYVAQWALYAWKTQQKGLIIFAAIVGLTGLAIWRLESVVKILKPEPTAPVLPQIKKSPDQGKVINIDPVTGDKTFRTYGD